MPSISITQKTNEKDAFLPPIKAFQDTETVANQEKVRSFSESAPSRGVKNNVWCLNTMSKIQKVDCLRCVCK